MGKPGRFRLVGTPESSGSSERDPRDTEVLRAGLAAARAALDATRHPPSFAAPLLHPVELLEPAEVLVDRAMADWPDVAACRAALQVLLAKAEQVDLRGLARQARAALTQLDPVAGLPLPSGILEAVEASVAASGRSQLRVIDALREHLGPA